MDMEPYILYLLYLSILLTIGIIATALTNTLRISNILILIIIGYMLKSYGYDFFNEDIVLVLSSLTLIMIVLKTTMELDLSNILNRFMRVLKFEAVYTLVSVYILTFSVFLLFDFPGDKFTVFVTCLLLSLIIVGADPAIIMEFVHIRKKKVREFLDIEGIISGPIIVVFSFFLIEYLASTGAAFSGGMFSNLGLLLHEGFVSVAIGVVIAFLYFKFHKTYPISRELTVLLLIVAGMGVFVGGEVLKGNGSLAVAAYGIMVRGFTHEPMPKRFTSLLAHTLYIIVFILFGIEFIYPPADLWLPSILLFGVYLLLRFMCLVLFTHDMTNREKLFITFNTAKGIEVALVLFLIKINFAGLRGVETILSIGFMFFILSYLLSTAVTHYSHLFLGRGHAHKHGGGKRHRHLTHGKILNKEELPQHA